MRNKHSSVKINKMIVLVMVMLFSSVVVLGAFVQTKPWHLLEQIVVNKGAAGLMSVDANSDGVIDKAEDADKFGGLLPADYLKIGDTAADSEKLGGSAAADYAKKSYFDADADAKVDDAAHAVNADKLGNIDAGLYATIAFFDADGDGKVDEAVRADSADTATTADTAAEATHAANADKLGDYAADQYMKVSDVSSMDKDDGDWAQASGSLFRVDGNIGIGIAEPTAKLDVVGNAKISGNLDVGGAVSSKGKPVLVGAGLSCQYLETQDWQVSHHIACPAGSLVMGGGCYVHYTNFFLQTSVPTADGTGWACQAADRDGVPGEVKARVVCCSIVEKLE